MAEQTDDGKIKTYLRGINLIVREIDRVVYYYIFNEHGDVTQLWSQSGTCKASYEYDAFGIERDPDNEDENPFRYCGEYYDSSSGIYYLRARYYDPATSRMLSEDSVWSSKVKLANGQEIDDPLSLNLYTYCHNDPINFIDPSGHDRIGTGMWSLKSDTAGRTLLAWYLLGNGNDFIAVDGDYGDYMKKDKGDPANGVKPLKEQVKAIVFKEGTALSLGESKTIDLTTSMTIENGEDIVGYQYLHGTNADVGGFKIKGTISKNEKGDITYDLAYTWNDRMDPNFIYDSDSKKAPFAKSIPGANPKDYTLRITWNDKTVIKANPGWFNWSKGWLS